MRFSWGSHGRRDGLPHTRDRGCLTQAVIELTKSHTTSHLKPSPANMDGVMTGGQRKKKSQSNLHKLNGQHEVEASLRRTLSSKKQLDSRGDERGMMAPLKWQDQLLGGVRLLTRLQITVHRKRVRGGRWREGSGRAWPSQTPGTTESPSTPPTLRQAGMFSTEN